MISNRARPMLLAAPFLPSPSRADHRSPVEADSQEMPLRAQDTAINELVAGNTVFGFDIFSAIGAAESGNILISPYSISVALAMAYAGARGETAAQMADVLGFTRAEPGLHDAFSALNAELVERGSTGDDEGALHLANALWVEQTYPIHPEYSAEIEAFYGGALHLVDFAHSPEESRLEINRWVEDQTEDRIRDIVQKGDITGDTALALTNAIHFLGLWKDHFDLSMTRDDDFTLRDGTTVTVPFMVKTDLVLSTRGGGFQAVELPYASSGFAMTIMLPDEDAFDVVSDSLDARLFDQAIQDLDWGEARLFVPKFEFEFGTIRLEDVLASMGMPIAFTKDADFRKMTDLSRAEPDDLLRIDRVLHKAFISVDEEGTEAAAATVVLASPGAGAPPLDPVEIRLDRPFFFAIRDMETGTVLFLGRVMDPRG